MTVRAALGLQRHRHETPATLRLELEQGAPETAGLAWPGTELANLAQHDHHRVTEDGAEAVALAVAHRHRGWRVVRRMQREEHADWLLEQTEEGTRQVVAFEVSGVDHGTIAARLAEKIAQVARSEDVDQRWAGVVGFELPIAALSSPDSARPKRGRR
jgi:hypothetical protein